jgi:hypothetical protein
MKSWHRTATASSWGLAFAVGAASVASIASAYTFDPLNNMWKPSGRPSTTSSSASSTATSSSYSSTGHHHTVGDQYDNQYSQQYPDYYGYSGDGRGDHFPSSEASHQHGVGDPYGTETARVFEEDVIRAQYSTWAGQYHNGENTNGGETFKQKSLVQIEYNKKTGEISLVDQDGIVTAEDYQRLMKIVMMPEDGRGEPSDTGVGEDGSSGLEFSAAGVAVGSTLYVDAEDLDQTKVIDTDAEVISSETTPLSPEQQQQLQQQMYERAQYEAQVAQTYEQLHHEQTYHEHAEYSLQTPSSVDEEIPASRSPVETFRSYNIPQSTSTSATYRQYQHQPVATASPATSVESNDSATMGGGFGFNQRRMAFM